VDKPGPSARMEKKCASACMHHSSFYPQKEQEALLLAMREEDVRHSGPCVQPYGPAKKGT